MNQGLVVISPIILVRLLTVEEFGTYREFLVYAGLLTTICAFGINNSLLYFIPARPQSVRQMLRQATLLTFFSSIVVIAAAVVANALTNGAVLGQFALPVALYVLLFCNLDFWEFYWLATKRPLPVFAYTTSRLVARITVVVTAAAISRDVMPIIWSLIALETVRIVGSAIAWRSIERDLPMHGDPCWREQFSYCLPLGMALILTTLNKSLGNLFVTKALGVVALAHYTIGTHIQPVIGVLRNSISDAVLPELARLKQGAGSDALALWRRSTVVSMILLTAAGVVLFEFAHPLVVTMFSPKYEAAVGIFQLYLLVLVREVFDFGVALRAANRTAPIVHSSLTAIGLNLLLLITLLPTIGLLGAALAFVISRWAEGLVLSRSTLRAYNISIRELANWSDLGKVALAALGAAVIFIGSFWTDQFGIAGVVLGSIVFMAIFTGLLLVLRVPEATAVINRLRKKSTRFLFAKS